MPLVLGDRFVTGPKSRAEVQFDGGNFARLSADTEVRIGELGNRRFEIEVVNGLVGFSQFDGFEADVDVETSLATVRTIKPAVVIVEHHGAGQTDVTVRDGAVEVFTDDGIEKVKGGLLSVRGDSNDVSLRTAKAEPKSGFDDWAKRRDKLLERDGRSTWRRWAPSYVGLGFGYGGYGYPWGATAVTAMGRATAPPSSIALPRGAVTAAAIEADLGDGGAKQPEQPPDCFFNRGIIQRQGGGDLVPRFCDGSQSAFVIGIAGSLDSGVHAVENLRRGLTRRGEIRLADLHRQRSQLTVQARDR